MRGWMARATAPKPPAVSHSCLPLQLRGHRPFRPLRLPRGSPKTRTPSTLPSPPFALMTRVTSDGGKWDEDQAPHHRSCGLCPPSARACA